MATTRAATCKSEQHRVALSALPFPHSIHLLPSFIIHHFVFFFRALFSNFGRFLHLASEWKEHLLEDRGEVRLGGGFPTQQQQRSLPLSTRDTRHSEQFPPHYTVREWETRNEGGWFCDHNHSTDYAIEDYQPWLLCSSITHVSHHHSILFWLGTNWEEGRFISFIPSSSEPFSSQNCWFSVKVSAKIRSLSEFQVRLQTNQQAPTSVEILTTLKYFQQTLVGYVYVHLIISYKY